MVFKILGCLVKKKNKYKVSAFFFKNNAPQNVCSEVCVKAGFRIDFQDHRRLLEQSL